MGIGFSTSLPVNSLFPCFKVVVEHISYCVRNLDKMNEMMRRLEAVRNDVQRRVEISERDGHHKRLYQVDEWLQQVNSRLLKAHCADERVRELQGRRCFGLSTNVIENYLCFRVITRMIRKMNSLVEEKDDHIGGMVVERFPMPQPIPKIQEFTVGTDPFVADVYGAISDNELGVIGLSGMGGIGKTTILKTLYNNLVTDHSLYDHIMWLDVKKVGSLEDFQNAIGKKMGFNEDAWVRKCFEEKADDITRVLNGKRYVLMLDDLCISFDLMKSGIPIPSPENRCKVIFTTRSIQFCRHMNAKKTFILECLSEDLAMDLFRLNVGNNIVFEDPHINEIATDIMKRCAGLPLALKIIGRSMADKWSLREWRNARADLTSNNVLGLQEQVFLCLKHSFDILPNSMLKSCLLRFVLNNECDSWDKGQMIITWYEEGFLGVDVGSLEEWEDKGHMVIEKFINLCLVEVMTGKDGIRLHEMMRSMLLWVACDFFKEEDQYFVKSGLGLTGVTDVKKWKNVKVASFMSNRIKEISIVSEKPFANLVALYLGCNCIESISLGCFTLMPNLKILDLSENENLYLLPPDIGCLQCLEYLNLEWTGIKLLPSELGRLTKLRALNLRHTTNLSVVPRGLLCGLNDLHVFRMSSWPAVAVALEDDNNALCDGNRLLIEELGHLKSLIAVELVIGSASALQTYMRFHELMTCSTNIWIENLGLIVEEITLNDMGKCLEYLRVENCVGLTKISYNEVNSKMKHGLRRLKHVNIYRCPKLKDINSLASYLESLTLSKCDNIEITASDKIEIIV